MDALAGSTIDAYADALRIRLRKLLDNAIRNAPKGGQVNVNITKNQDRLGDCCLDTASALGLGQGTSQAALNS